MRNKIVKTLSIAAAVIAFQAPTAGFATTAAECIDDICSKIVTRCTNRCITLPTEQERTECLTDICIKASEKCNHLCSQMFPEEEEKK